MKLNSIAAVSFLFWFIPR